MPTHGKASRQNASTSNKSHEKQPVILDRCLWIAEKAEKHGKDGEEDDKEEDKEEDDDEEERVKEAEDEEKKDEEDEEIEKEEEEYDNEDKQEKKKKRKKEKKKMMIERIKKKNMQMLFTENIYPGSGLFSIFLEMHMKTFFAMKT